MKQFEKLFSMDGPITVVAHVIKRFVVSFSLELACEWICLSKFYFSTAP